MGLSHQTQKMSSFKVVLRIKLRVGGCHVLVVSSRSLLGNWELGNTSHQIDAVGHSPRRSLESNVLGDIYCWVSEFSRSNCNPVLKLYEWAMKSAAFRERVRLWQWAVLSHLWFSWHLPQSTLELRVPVEFEIDAEVLCQSHRSWVDGWEFGFAYYVAL